jgi:hypothetical protein
MRLDGGAGIVIIMSMPRTSFHFENRSKNNAGTAADAPPGAAAFKP